MATAWGTPGRPGSTGDDMTPIACGAIYQVKEGDWLTRIAKRAYGDADYLTIYQANRDVLRDLSSLSVGVELLIPCRDGPGTRAEARTAAEMARSPDTGMEQAAPAPQQPVAPPVAPPAAESAPPVPADAPPAAIDPVPDLTAAPAPVELSDIKLVSGRDFPPFADPGLPQGGMIGDLVKRALEITAPDHPTPKIFLDDGPEHLKLLKDGAFDISFPWFKPDCSHIDRLTGIMRQLCSGFVFSNPIYEVDMRIYVRADSPLAQATTPDALFGKRLCRPAGQITFDLQQARLFEPNVTRVIPPTAGDCFAWLARGDADAVSLDSATGAAEIQRLGLDGQVVPVAALDSALTLHVIAAEDSLKGRMAVGLFNAGLRELQMSGTWFEVVAYHQGSYAISTR